ncbi:protein TsetseEP-like isoform X2 [Sparus aurata]|uniref:protein TsetseEP-like isoform X2 n=1 Tax=Sparus aurata TaxID=8175 RepID=UPI0011C18D74|nr:protein TsetseEP-like isoform X2 [Sparus aurata]
MSKVQILRSLVKQRLTAAAEEICALFERTIAEYEEELCRSTEQNQRHRNLLDSALTPQLRLHRADVQQLFGQKKVSPEQQEWSSSLDQQDPEPPHIKDEQEELWTKQEEADITEFTFTLVPVKNEDEDEEKPQSSQLYQRQTEQMETKADGQDCGGPEPARNSVPDRHLQSGTEDRTGDSPEPEAEDSPEPEAEDSPGPEAEDSPGPEAEDSPGPEAEDSPGPQAEDNDDVWSETKEPQSRGRLHNPVVPHCLQNEEIIFRRRRNHRGPVLPSDWSRCLIAAGLHLLLDFTADPRSHLKQVGVSSQTGHASHNERPK